MADHFLETPENEQSINLCLVYLKGAKFIKGMTSKYKFRWLVGEGPTLPPSHLPPQTKIPRSAPAHGLELYHYLTQTALCYMPPHL